MPLGAGEAGQFGNGQSRLRFRERAEFPLCRSVQIAKNAIVASAMMAVASHPTAAMEGGSVSRPMMRRFMAITIITAISGAASTPFTTALQ